VCIDTLLGQTTAELATRSRDPNGSREIQFGSRDSNFPGISRSSSSSSNVTSAGSQRALVALDGVVNQQMSFEFVLAVERTAANVALERLDTAVYHHMHLEVLFRLEALHAQRTLEVCCKKHTHSDIYLRCH